MLWDFYRGSKAYFIITALLAVVLTFSEMINPQIIRITIDSVLGTEEPDLPNFILSAINRIGGMELFKKDIWLIGACIIAVASFSALCRYLYRVINAKFSETFVETVRNRLFGHIERLPFEWHMKNQTGDIIQRCTSDVNMIKTFLSDHLSAVFRIMSSIIWALVFMFVMNWHLALISFAAIPIILTYSAVFHRQINRGYTLTDEKEGELSAIAQENLTGVRVVRAFGREKYERDRFEKCDSDYSTLWMKLCLKLSTFWTTADMISGIQVMLIVIVGAYMCTRNTMLPGEYIAFISYNAMLTWPVRQLGRIIAELSKSGVSLARLKYIMAAEEESEAESEMPDMHGDIKLDHVTFRYDGTSDILKDISLNIPAGSTLGILGGTGSGKSTLMLLLDKLYDLPEGCGSITVGGVDIRSISSSYLRKNIGIVLQEPFLFSRSIADNISIANNSAALEDIRKAADIACLDETVMGFSNGYDTFVGERGVTLSGGQKQRAAIARLLINRTPIIIFDDSLSAVDTETDAKIRRALKDNLKDSTVILISHRITTLMQADNIIVLDKGTIAEEGSHEELLKRGGIYSKIYDIQSKNAEDDIGKEVIE